jgi:hypothetical protein
MKTIYFKVKLHQKNSKISSQNKFLIIFIF